MLCLTDVSSMTTMVFLLCSIAALLQIQVVHSWVLISRHSTQVAFSASYDLTTGKLATTGVLFRTAYQDLTLHGASDTDCYVALGDSDSFDRAVYKTPQVCSGFLNFPSPLDDGDAAILLPAAVSTGMDGDQGTVAALDTSGPDKSNIPRRDVVNLPWQHFPHVLTTDSKGAVYVGLHETGGILPPLASLDRNDELVGVVNYYRTLTHPSLTTHVTSPQVVKINILTSETEWQTELSTTEGRSTVGGISHLAARDIVVVAGSSNGRGSLVGAREWSNSWDGYVTILNATTGLADETAGAETYHAADHSTRIQSQIGRDEYILGMCAFDDNIYVLGTTSGKISSESTENGGGFIMMLDVDTLNIKWTYQWAGVGVEALRCAASSSLLYVSGIVPAGIKLNEDETRTFVSPTQDVFVARFDPQNGNLAWTRQIDSRRHDVSVEILASRSGYGLVISNAMDFENGTNEILVFSISFDGEYDWQDLPAEADPILGGGFETEPGTKSVVKSDSDENRTAIIVTAVLVPLLLLVVVALFVQKSRSKEDGVEQRIQNTTPKEESGVV